MFGPEIDTFPRCALTLVAGLLVLAVWQADPVAGRWSAAAVAADDDTADAPKPKGQGDKDDAAEDAAKLYQVPDTKSSAELLKFIDKIREYEPESIEDAVAHQKQAPQAIKAAAEQILKVEKDKSSEAYQTARLLLQALRIASIKEATPAEQRAMIDEIVKPLSEPEPSREDFGLALMLTRQLDYLKDTKLAASTFLSIAKVFKASKDEQIAELGASFEGAARRVDLVGKPMKVEGHRVDGKAFDWKAYLGKVVLVDFWATWCGPCRAELPNIRRAYDEYHGRGFDVVAVSVDDDPQDVKHFLAEEEIPWVTLIDQDPKAPDHHPLADYYGFMGRIPRTMLVGKDGKVVTLSARGEELWDQLGKLLGPVTKEKAEEEKPPVKPSKPAPSIKPKGTGK